MAAYRNPAEAVQAFLDDLQLAVSCVTRDVLIHARPDDVLAQMRTTFLPRRPVPLSGRPPLGLEVSQFYCVEEDALAPETWTVRTAGYRFHLRLREGPELLAYHWHPDDPNPVKIPHLHLSAGAQVQFDALARAHIPTGPVQLHDVLRLAIEDLGVRPLRPDWANVLAKPRP